jgi:hypothetical protein
MASNVKIVGNIISTTTVSRYSENDIKLIPSKKLQENFGGTGDYIEYYVYDIAGNLLNSNYNYLSYKLPTDIGLTPGVNTLPNTAGSIQTTNIGIDSTLATPTSSLYPIIEIDPVQDLQNLGYSSGEFITKYFLLIDSKYLSHNTIAHEIYHAVVGITEDRGITDEEAQSWLCGHITSVMYKFLEKKKFEIKHG